MKKNIFIGMVTCMFAVAISFNFNLEQSNNVSDISLEDITVMAQAQGESGGGDCLPNFPGYCSWGDFAKPGRFV